MNHEIRQAIIDRYSAEEIVEILSLSTDTLVDVLEDVIDDNMGKFETLISDLYGDDYGL